MKRNLFFAALTFLLLLSGCRELETMEQVHSVSRSTQPRQESTQPVPEQTSAPTVMEEEPTMETQSLLLTEPRDTDLVRVLDYIPDIEQELIYATANNFTGSVIYDFQDVYLRYGSVKKLAAVQDELRSMGLGLKIWDGFRPVSAQFKLWEICPDDTYVANPNVGYSNHSRGFAIDLTLIDENGNELEMPTGFDDFSGKADRNYADVSEVARDHSLLLERIMEKHGFLGYSGEWWHYNDSTRYEVEHVFDPGLISCWMVSGEDQGKLMENAASGSPILTSIAPGQTVTVMGYTGEYALVTYQGLRGYILCSSLFPV